jgi:hypothetical protein
MEYVRLLHAQRVEHMPTEVVIRASTGAPQLQAR